MPYTIKFDDAHKRISVLVAPPTGGYDGLECLRDVRTHPAFREDYRVLFNMLVADRPLRREEAEQIGSTLKYFFPKQKVACVRHNPPVTQSFEVLRATASEALDVGIFSELSAAESWLES